MTARTDGPPICPNLGHAGGAVLAVTTITTWPDGDAAQTLACSGCAHTAITEALARGSTIRLDPVLSAYGVCPLCGTSTRLRPASGMVGSHRDGWVACMGKGLPPAKPTRRVVDVPLPETAAGT